MTARNQAFFWSLISIGFLGFVFLFRAVLLPFALGLAVAYLLNPLVGMLGRRKIGRGPAALLILGSFLLLMLLAMAAITPLLYRQMLELAQDIPGYYERVLAMIEPLSQKILALTGQKNGDLRALLSAQAGSAASLAGSVLSGLAAGGQALLGISSVLVLMPIVAYFMMKEWNGICAWVEDLLPRDKKEVILGLLSQIDRKISGFVRGQISVALILGVSYAIALTIAGLKYGFLIGLSAGLLSIIPMVGSVTGLIVGTVVAWFQTGDLFYVGTIAAIFLVGQLIEGNFLTPKLVGESVGMHPLWVFFALLAGGALFGILGMILAVPVAAVIGVLAGFFIMQYKASPYYKGLKKPPSSPEKGE